MDLKIRRKQQTAVAHAKKSTKGTGAKDAATDLPTTLSKDRPASLESLHIIQRDGSLISTINNLESLTKGFEIGPASHRFKLIRRLGTERESRVWLATTLNKDITDTAYYRALKVFALRDYKAEIKTIKAERNQTSRADLQNLLRMSLSRFKARCEIAAQFNHPNIVKIYGWRQGEDGWPFVEMEFLDPRTGQNLARLLHLEGTPGLDWPRTVELLRPIAAALDYAHREHRLAHRNLKPENVFITERGIVKLLDFGLTYQPRQLRGGLSGLDSDSLDALGESSAAEQVRFKQDIGGLAALTYELLTGRPPYQDVVALGRDAETWPMLLSGKTPPCASAGAEPLPPKPAVLTDAAWTVLHEALAYHSPACPPTAAQLLQQLEIAQQPSLTVSATHRLYFGKHQGIVIGLTGLLITGAIGSAGFYFWNDHSKLDSLLRPMKQETAKLATIDSGQQSASKRGEKSPPNRPNASNSSLLNGAVDSPKSTEAVVANLPQQNTDNRAFAAAQRIDTVAAYRLYLQRCPNCNHQQTAEAAIARLQRQGQITALQTRLKHTLEAAALSNARQRDRVLQMLKELAALDPQHPLIAKIKQRIAVAYEALAQTHLQQGNYPEAQNWLTKGETIWPSRKEWTVLASNIQEAEAKAQDDALYARAQLADTPSAYQAYLRHCAPPCSHQQEAQSALEQLEAEKIVRDTLADGSLGPEMVIITAGTFVMGSPPAEVGRYQSEHEQQVKIKRPFAMGRYEVTFEEYDKFAEATGREKPDDEGWGRGRHPVINITWHDATAYAQWLSTQTKQHYRLPTEAEWEYATRAGTRTARYWGNNPDQGCRYANAADLVLKEKFSGWNVMECRDDYMHTAPVGSYQPNGYGLYDTLGNVLEWTCSIYHEVADVSQKTCEQRHSGGYYVARGGSWSDEPRSLRAADRYKAASDYQDYFLGFRLVRDL